MQYALTEDGTPRPTSSSFAHRSAGALGYNAVFELVADRWEICKSRVGTRAKVTFKGSEPIPGSPSYGCGSDTCSCTISHFPSCLSKTAVQRNVAISRLPDFCVMSDATVAVIQ